MKLQKKLPGKGVAQGVLLTGSDTLFAGALAGRGAGLTFTSCGTGMVAPRSSSIFKISKWFLRKSFKWPRMNLWAARIRGVTSAVKLAVQSSMLSQE